MSKKPVEEHYDILYQDEQGTRFTVFASTDLNTLGYILADMLKFEEITTTLTLWRNQRSPHPLKMGEFPHCKHLYGQD